jgi:hypothetical protein
MDTSAHADTAGRRKPRAAPDEPWDRIPTREDSWIDIAYSVPRGERSAKKKVVKKPCSYPRLTHWLEPAKWSG